MRQPPRNPNEALFGKPVIAISLLQGMMVLLAGLGILAYAMRTGASDEEARALTFFTLVIGHLGLIHVNRSWTQGFFSLFSSSNPAVWWVTLSASVFILLAMTVPFLQSIFHFAPIPPGQFALGAVAGLASVLWFELIKAARRR